MIRRRSACLGCGVVASLWSRKSHPQGYGSSETLGPFTAPELARARAVFRSNVVGAFGDMMGRLPPDRRAAVRDVVIEVPDEAPYGGNFVLQVYFEFDKRRVVLPIRTIIWLGELSGLMAHLHWQKCTSALSLCMLYAGMLQSNRSATTRPPGPLVAFGLSDAIYNDQRVKELAGKILNSTVYFLLAHELGHAWHRHSGGRAGRQSQNQEREADVFAIELLEALKVYPLGLSLMFSVAAMMEGEQNTHPASGSRVYALADSLDRRAAAFVPPQQDAQTLIARFRADAAQLKAAVSIIDDGSLRGSLLAHGRGVSFSELPNAMARLC